MATFPGLGDRIAQRLTALGYVRQGRPDIARFIREYGYDPRSFYPWANNNRVPRFETLIKLAADLETSPAWLLLGERAAGPEGRGEAQTGGPAGDVRPRDTKRAEALRYLDACFDAADDGQKDLVLQVLKAHADAVRKSGGADKSEKRRVAAQRRPFP